MNCSKIPFESRAAVKAWMRYQNRQGRRTAGGASIRGGHAYVCPICGFWHWTSMSKAEARRRGLA